MAWPTVDSQNFNYRKTIDITSSSVSLSANVTDSFVVVELLTADTYWVNQDAAALHVRFTTIGGTVLHFKPLLFDTTTSAEHALFYVQIPTITYASDTSIYMYHDDAGTPANYSTPDSTFKSSIIDLWPLGDDGWGTAPEAKSFPSAGTDLTVDSTSISAATGMVGEGRAFTSSTSEFLSATISDYQGSDTQGTFYGAFKSSYTAANQVPFAIELPGTGDPWLRIILAATTGDLYFEIYSGGSVTLLHDNVAGWSDGNFHTYQITSTGSAYKVRIDGVDRAFTMDAGTDDGDWIAAMTSALTSTITLGGFQFTSSTVIQDPFIGDLDELMYVNATESVDQAIVFHQSSLGTWMTVGVSTLQAILSETLADATGIINVDTKTVATLSETLADAVGVINATTPNIASISETLADATGVIVVDSGGVSATLSETLANATGAIAASINNIATISETSADAIGLINVAITLTVTEDFSIDLTHPVTGAMLTGLGDATVWLEIYKPNTNEWHNFTTNSFQATYEAATKYYLAENVLGNHDGQYQTPDDVTTTLWTGDISLRVRYLYDASDGRGSISYYIPSIEYYIAGTRQVTGMPADAYFQLMSLPLLDAINNGVRSEMDDNSTKLISIDAKTGQMVFTKANELDVNTKSINSAGVIGDGNATPWDGE